MSCFGGDYLRTQLATNGDHDRTKCPNCSNCIRDLREENAALRQERDALVQVSADVCPECGWAMKFPDEPCRNCEVIALRKVVKKADALAHVAGMFPVPVEGTALYAVYKEYMEVRHG